jgi:hypothetical protein
VNTTIASGLVIIIVGLAFLFIARRILRLALKVAFVLVLVFVLLGGATVAWWQGWFSSSSSVRTPASQTNQRTNTNRRPNQR